MKSIIIILLLIISTLTKAQSTISLLDLSISPVITTSTDGTITTTYEFYFQVDQPELVEKIVLKAGTAEETGDIKEIMAEVNHEEGRHYINYEDKQYEIEDGEVSFPLPLSDTEASSVVVCTLCILDNTGEETEHYYLNK